MTPQTETLIRELAQTLGTTTEYLWGILIKQAHVSAWMHLGGTILLLLISVALVLLGRFCFKKMRVIEAHIPLWAGSALGLIVAFCNFTFATMPRFMNPEFYALQYIMNRL